MAIKSTIYKAAVQIADMDRALYADHALTLALHPSETEERLMVRLLAFAMQVPASDHGGALQFARGRLAKACGRARRVTVYCYGSASHIWWAALQPKVARLGNLTVWQLPAAQAQALAALARRSMQVQVTVQEGHVWVGTDSDSVEIQLRALQEPDPSA